MTTILATFFIALLISLGATPLAAKLGRLAGAVDKPAPRKVHRVPTPRSGGIAIFAAFVVTVHLSKFLGTSVSELFIWDYRNAAFLAGALIVFAVGLADDIYRLKATLKLLFQVLAASVAFAGGLQINTYFFTGVATNSFIVSYCLTVFWFVLLINAINLIDGLDGLAGGIAFFACLILTILLVLQKQYLPAMLFAALGGSVLGFLRYNFNPASVFMGDGGSYFLGYAIAGLSIIGSAKVQTGAVVLIPLLAMGVPVFDTILSPIRRFLVGKKLFQPDKGHIHHRLMEMGLSTRKVVLLIYAASVALCLFALVLVNFHDRRAGLFLIIVGVAAIVFIRKLGYFEYLGSDKLLGWFRDITDVAGLSHDRRSFLGLQIEISHSRTVEEMWQNVCQALAFLGLDKADFHLPPPAEGKEEGAMRHDREERLSEASPPQQGEGPPIRQTSQQNGKERLFHWARGCDQGSEDVEKESIFAIKLPLMNGSPAKAGTLFLMKDLETQQIDGFTLRRIGQLHETMVKTLEWIEREQKNAAKAAVQGSMLGKGTVISMLRMYPSGKRAQGKNWM